MADAAVVKISNEHQIDRGLQKATEVIVDQRQPAAGNRSRQLANSEHVVEAQVVASHEPVVVNIVAEGANSSPVAQFELDTTAEFHLGEAWGVTFLAGIFGGHWFYFRQPLKGFAYLFSFGLLGLGYAVDLLRLPLIVARQRAKFSAKQHKEAYLFEPLYSEAYLMLFITGIIGGHHFYLNNYAKGLLYFCTLGLLGIGVALDFFILPDYVQIARFRNNRIYREKYGADALAKAKARNNEEYNKVKSALTPVPFWKKLNEREVILIAQEITAVENEYAANRKVQLENGHQTAQQTNEEEVAQETSELKSAF